jgi:hypothetical protein
MFVRHCLAFVASLLLASCEGRRALSSPSEGNGPPSTDTAKSRAEECHSPCTQLIVDETAALQSLVNANTPSMFDRLKLEGRQALLGDKQGIYAIDATGDVEYVLNESFSWMTIDYGAGLLWLNRTTSKSGEPGLFVVNLAEPEPSLIKIARLKRPVEIYDGQGNFLPMTEGKRPYRISMHSSPISIALFSSSKKICGTECEVEATAIELGNQARKQYGLWASPLPEIHRLLYPDSPGLDIGESFTLPWTHRQLEIRAVGMPDHGPDSHVWQLYDVAAGEYMSPAYGVRSGRKLAEGYQLQHVMVCDGGQGIVFDDGFFGPDLARLDAGGNSVYGVCLSGGGLFEGRSELYDD